MTPRLPVRPRPPVVPRRLARPVRLAAAGVLVAALAATLGTTGTSSAAPAPAPTSPGPSSPGPSSPGPAGEPPLDGTACPPKDGIVVTDTMAASIIDADQHVTPLPASGSFGSGDVECGKNTEPDDGWEGSGVPAPPDVDPDADDEDDPFDRQNGLYLGYQFDRAAGGLPDYWEQPIAFGAGDAELIATAWTGVSGVAYSMTEVGWGDADTRETVQGILPQGPGCRWHGPVPATAMPGRVADYARGGRPVHKYDHVAMRIGARKFASARGDWFHYLCGAATPSGVSGPAPGTRLTGVQGDYYLTPHWVYAEGFTADQLTTVAPILRAARGAVDAQVLTSPENRSVVNLRTWMWSGARRYDFTLGGRPATVVPTGIRVVARDVPLQAHDLRAGGCRTGGVPDVGDPDGETDCWFRFTKANSADPADVYTVGFALRWEVRVAGVPPLTFWTTREQTFKVGEVQVPVGGG